MSEYRRFVAYIYAYRDGKKLKNTGYIKVDARNGVCRMQVYVQLLEMKNQKLTLYGFVRAKEWLLGIPLGEGQAKNGTCQMRISTGTEQLGNSEYGLSENSGIWLKGEAGENYISVWDEEPIETDRFTLQLPEEEPMTPEMETEEQSVTAEQIDIQEQISEPDISQQVTESHTEQPASDSLYQRWPQFLYHYPESHPFEDEEIKQCIRIAPKDISFLGEKEWKFGQNPFLKQGYGRYGHLLLGLHGNGCFLLAVPGMYYDAQDRHLARMYGFPEFKKVAHLEENMYLPEGEDGEHFGYWYHFINS